MMRLHTRIRGNQFGFPLLLYAPIHVVCALTMLLRPPCALSQDCPDYQCPRVPKKLALVIGNSNYQNLLALPGSKADAELMAQRLRELEFDVDYHADCKTRSEFEEEIFQDFRKKIDVGDFVVFYFSGHGFGYGPDNFLAPTSIPLSIPSDKVTRYAISVGAFENLVASHKPGLILFLIDACRSIGGFEVKNQQGDNVVEKGSADQQRNDDDATNALIAFASKQGKPAMGSGDPERLSVFTQALTDHIRTEGQPFGFVFSVLSSEVVFTTNEKQVPGLVNWSRTDPFFKPTARNLEEQKESWLSILQTGKAIGISTFLQCYSVSPYAWAARKWLDDNLNNLQAARFTFFSPLAIDRAWRATNENRVTVRSLAIPFAYDRSLEQDQDQALQKFTEAEIGLVPSGTSPEKIAQLRTGEEYFLNNNTKDSRLLTENFYRGSLAFSLANIDAHGDVVTTEELVGHTEPNLHSIVAKNIPPGTKVRINAVQLGTDNYIFLKTSTPGDPTPMYLKVDPVTTPAPLELGQSLKEVMAPPRANSIPELLNPEPIKEALAELKAQGWKITWVSLATAPTDDEREREARSARMANAEYILKRAGIDGRRITSVSGVQDVSGNDVRVRFFGFH